LQTLGSENDLAEIFLPWHAFHLWMSGYLAGAISPRPIDLGLERVAGVYDRLSDQPKNTDHYGSRHQWQRFLRRFS
jgi:hypothetical protein